MVYYKSEYVVIGGTSVSTTDVYSSCESWDKSNPWKSFPSLVKAWKNPASIVFNDVIYVFAGINNNKVIMNTIEKFDGTKWELIDTWLPY